jgi:hypothetical protein
MRVMLPARRCAVGRAWCCVLVKRVVGRCAGNMLKRCCLRLQNDPGPS